MRNLAVAVMCSLALACSPSKDATQISTQPVTPAERPPAIPVERVLTAQQKVRRSELWRELFQERGREVYRSMEGEPALQHQELFSLADRTKLNGENTWYEFLYGEGENEGDGALVITVIDGVISKVRQEVLIR